MKAGNGFWIISAPLWIAVVTSDANGSGSGLNSAGCLTTGPTGKSGARQWISLRSAGEFLEGKVPEGAVKRLRIHAPGVENGNVILREIQFPDGGRSILVTGPIYLESAVQRVFVYVSGNPQTSVLLEYHDGTWTKATRVVATEVEFLSDESGLAHASLLEFRVAGLGQYHLLGSSPTSAHDQVPILPTVSAHGLVGGTVSRGLWHLGWAALLLTFVGGASRWAHSIQSRQ